MLRILIVSHGHPAHSAAGAEIASYELFRALRQQSGVLVSYLAWVEAASDRPDAPAFSELPGRASEFVFFADGFDRFALSQPDPTVAAGFAAFLQRLAPDVVHFHHYVNVGLQLIETARQYRPPIRIIITLHEYIAICHHHGVMVRRDNGALCGAATDAACAQCFPNRAVAAFAQRRQRLLAAFAQVDLFIAPSAFLRRRYLGWGLPGWQVVTLENGIAPMAPCPPRPLRPGERRARFGFFGQIHPFKGLLELLAAFDHIPPGHGADLRLVIHGAYLELNDPAYIAAVRAGLARHSARVRFAGRYDRAQQRALLAELDWVVVPSIWWENSPLVIQEALACRRPVLCSDIGGMAEKVRPGLDGLHVRAGDPPALATTMLHAAGDPALWNALQATMRRPTDAATSAAAHLELYRDRAFSFAPTASGSHGSTATAAAESGLASAPPGSVL